MLALILGILIYPISIVGLIPFAIVGKPPVLTMVLVGVAIILMVIVAPLLFAGIKVLKPNEAYVLTLFGKYYGTLKGAGMFSVNPFVTAVNPAAEPSSQPAATTEQGRSKDTISSGRVSKKISMKAMTFGNEKQKINDLMGNPIVIGIVVIWKVTNTTKAVFNVDNYREFLSIQCDSALRNIVRLYPYDVATDGDEKSLRGSSQEIAKNLQAEIQARVDVAGLEICEARITHLAYAPEIAAVMLQRQQASAIVDARKMIVEGAVGMVEMALDQLSENHVVELDEERKAAMVSNLLVVLCGNKDAQPVVNSGSLY
ncbi:MAG: SPFH domain-containing protein [Evtepia sp.]